jgi:hypothetical protein
MKEYAPPNKKICTRQWVILIDQSRTYGCDARIGYGEIDGHAHPKLTAETSDTGEEAAEHDTTDP